MSDVWGCWVVWDSGGGEWMWDTTAKDYYGHVYCPLVFAERRKEIMPLVREMRALPQFKSAKAVKVQMPEGPP